MKKIFFLSICAIMHTFCFGQTQSEMNKQANVDLQNADQALNKVYQQILNQYKGDKVFTGNLKKAQRIWIQLRDAEMLAKYPNRGAGYYGSVQPMCWSMYQTELTLERTKKLKVWLTGIEEGDVCFGSVKRKE